MTRAPIPSLDGEALSVARDDGAVILRGCAGPVALAPAQAIELAARLLMAANLEMARRPGG